MTGVPVNNRFDRDFDLVLPGEYNGVANRFERMIEADIGGLSTMLMEKNCTLLGRAQGGYLLLQLRDDKGHIYANGKFRGIYPGLLGMSECFKDGWDLVHETYAIPFEIDATAPSLDDEDLPNEIDKFLKGVVTGTFALSFDMSGCFNVLLQERRPPKKERRGGRLLTYSQTAERRGRSPDLFEAMRLAIREPEEIKSHLVMDP